MDWFNVASSLGYADVLSEGGPVPVELNILMPSGSGIYYRLGVGQMSHPLPGYAQSDRSFSVTPCVTMAPPNVMYWTATMGSAKGSLPA